LIYVLSRDIVSVEMRNPLPIPAVASLLDADRDAGDESGQLPEWLIHRLAMLILFLLEHICAARLKRARRQSFCWPDQRPDLPAGSTQSEAASIRGAFGNAIAWMCHRRGIGPGHPDWPELSRAIVAFGGSVKGFRAGAPAWGLQWWENPNVVPGMVAGFGAPVAATAALPRREAVADTAPPAANALQVEVVHAMLPGSWVAAFVRQVFARAGPAPSTGPPRCSGLPILSCLMHGAGARLAPPS
jgi:hypothetical protein